MEASRVQQPLFAFIRFCRQGLVGRLGERFRIPAAALSYRVIRMTTAWRYNICS